MGGFVFFGDNVMGLMMVGVMVFKVVMLNDIDVMEFFDKFCIVLDVQLKIVVLKSKEVRWLVKIVKGMLVEVGGVFINYKVYLIKDVNVWVMGNGCVCVYGGLMILMNDNELWVVIGYEIGYVVLGYVKFLMQMVYVVLVVCQVVGLVGNVGVVVFSNL